MVQMTRKSIKTPGSRGRTSCLLLFCALLFGTVVFLTSTITSDKSGNRKFNLPWVKEGKGNSSITIFSKLLSALEESKKKSESKKKGSKGNKAKNKKTSSKPFNRDSTMTLKKLDYSHIGAKEYPSIHVETSKIEADKKRRKEGRVIRNG